MLHSIIVHSLLFILTLSVFLHFICLYYYWGETEDYVAQREERCWLLPYDCWDSTLSTTRRYSICFIIRLIITVSFSFFLCNLVPNLNNVKINVLMKLYGIQTRWRFKKLFYVCFSLFLCIYLYVPSTRLKKIKTSYFCLFLTLLSFYFFLLFSSLYYGLFIRFLFVAPF